MFPRKLFKGVELLQDEILVVSASFEEIATYSPFSASYFQHAIKVLVSRGYEGIESERPPRTCEILL